MLVILKKETSEPSLALRLMTSPEVVWASSLVVAFVTDGVSATGVSVSEKVSATVWPPLVAVTVMVTGPLRKVFLSAAGLIVRVKGEFAPVTLRLALVTIVVLLDAT